MNTNQINYLNIGLMILSCVIAFFIPFELFLFSYAILGPLHYLTEISWLHKRQCFSPGKNDFILMGVMALAITIANLIPYIYMRWGPKDTNDQPIITEGIADLFNFLGHSVGGMIFVAFAGAAIMILTKSTVKRVVGFLVLAIIAYMLRTEKFMFLTFAVLLPTLVHVYLFTGLFILVGALKSRSASGILSLVVFAACTASIFLLFPDLITPPGAYAEQTYSASFFTYSQQLFDAFTHQQATPDLVYRTSFGTILARFVAFAYTYHYLNWFSKTSIIKWHQVPRKSLIMVLTIWLGSLAIYAIDYKAGIMALFFLSFLHVIFEFPLNFQSFKDIGVEIGKRIGLARG